MRCARNEPRHVSAYRKRSLIGGGKKSSSWAWERAGKTRVMDPISAPLPAANLIAIGTFSRCNPSPNRLGWQTPSVASVHSSGRPGQHRKAPDTRPWKKGTHRIFTTASHRQSRWFWLLTTTRGDIVDSLHVSTFERWTSCRSRNQPTCHDSVAIEERSREHFYSG